MRHSSPLPTPRFSPLEPIFAPYVGMIPFAFQEQFLHSPEYPFSVALQGVIHQLWHRPRWLTPLFWLLENIGILISEQGYDIPTTLEVRPGYDQNGRPYHTWARTLRFRKRRIFNTTIIYAPDLNHVVDLVGPNNALYMVWRAQFHPPDTFTLHTAACALRFGKRRIWLPGWLWRWALGVVRFRQRVDTTHEDMVHIGLVIRHPSLGDIFGYTGTFTVVRTATNNQPTSVQRDNQKIEKIAIPRGTLVASVFPRTDYADAYRAKLPAGAPRNIDAIARASFSAAPRWVRALMALRDGIVSVVGLKTSGKGERTLENLTFEPGASFGVFRVFARNADEILLGQDDRHLDFRVSVLRQTEDATDWVVVSTVVRFNNWLGRAYFTPVRLFHRLIVPAMIRSAIRKQMQG